MSCHGSLIVYLLYMDGRPLAFGCHQQEPWFLQRNLHLVVDEIAL